MAFCIIYEVLFPHSSLFLSLAHSLCLCCSCCFFGVSQKCAGKGLGRHKIESVFVPSISSKTVSILMRYIRIGSEANRNSNVKRFGFFRSPQAINSGESDAAAARIFTKTRKLHIRQVRVLRFFISCVCVLNATFVQLIHLSFGCVYLCFGLYRMLSKSRSIRHSSRQIHFRCLPTFFFAILIFDAFNNQHSSLFAIPLLPFSLSLSLSELQYQFRFFVCQYQTSHLRIQRVVK